MVGFNTQASQISRFPGTDTEVWGMLGCIPSLWQRLQRHGQLWRIGASLEQRKHGRLAITMSGKQSKNGFFHGWSSFYISVFIIFPILHFCTDWCHCNILQYSISWRWRSHEISISSPFQTGNPRNQSETSGSPRPEISIDLRHLCSRASSWALGRVNPKGHCGSRLRPFLGRPPWRQGLQCGGRVANTSQGRLG